MLALAAHILKKETLLQGKNIGKRYCIVMTFLFPEISLESHICSEVEKNKIEQPLVNLSGTHDDDSYFSHGQTDEFKCEIQSVKVREAVCCLEMQEARSLSSSQHFPSTKGW